MKTLARSQGSRKAVWIAGVFALVFFVVIGLSGCSGGNSESSESSVPDAYKDLDSVTLIAADSTGKGAAGQLWGQSFAQHVSDDTGGKITVEYHPNGELGGDTDLLRQEQSNDIQMVVTQPATEVSFIDDLAVFDAPMAFANYDADQIDQVLNGDNKFTKKLQSAFEDAGFHNLGWLQAGTYRVTTSNKDLSKLSDFKGFQIRTMENSNNMAFWSALGAEPTPLAFSEVYFALQNGTVDGQENATDTCVGSSFQEVQKYLCNTKHTLYVNNISINKDTWDSLDPAYQDAINKAVQEATDEIQPQITELDKSSIKTMTDAGMKVIDYDDGFFDQVLALDGVKKVYSDVSKQTDGLSDTMIDLLEKTKK